jgi:hypothetical protein
MWLFVLRRELSSRLRFWILYTYIYISSVVIFDPFLTLISSDCKVIVWNVDWEGESTTFDQVKKDKKSHVFMHKANIFFSEMSGFQVFQLFGWDVKFESLNEALQVMF